MLVDVFSKGVTGKVAEAALGKAGITVNKNAIPFDQNPPMVASGIRVGTPAVTTRGMREPEMDVDRRADRARRWPRRTTIARSGMVKDRGRAAVPEVPAVPGTCRPDPDRGRVASFSDAGALGARRSTATSRATASGGWPKPSPPSSKTAARCWPKPAPAPARRSPI